MTFKLLCLGAAAALVIAPAAFAQTSAPMGAQNPTPPTETPMSPAAPTTPTAPAQTTDPSANVGSAANANATVGGTTPNASCTAAAKMGAKPTGMNGSTSDCSTSNGSQMTAPNGTTPAPNGMAPTAPK